MDWTIASKVLPLLVYPLNLSIWLLFMAVFFHCRRKRSSTTICITLSLCVLLVSSSPPVSRELVRYLEEQYPIVEVEQYANASMIVVLGGALGLPYSPRIYPDLQNGSDRILHAVRLYKAGKAPTVFVSAGRAFKGNSFPEEAFFISTLLQDWGVPESAIVLDTDSGSTRENGIQTLQYLQAEGIENEPLLLVTSAWHMPRAMSVFEKLGLTVTAAATDIETTKSSDLRILDWLPSSGALATTHQMVKEYLGIIVYKLRGWA